MANIFVVCTIYGRGTNGTLSNNTYRYFQKKDFLLIFLFLKKEKQSFSGSICCNYVPNVPIHQKGKKIEG
jgi:hypothetical protein